MKLPHLRQLATLGLCLAAVVVCTLFGCGSPAASEPDNFRGVSLPGGAHCGRHSISEGKRKIGARGGKGRDLATGSEEADGLSRDILEVGAAHRRSLSDAREARQANRRPRSGARAARGV